MANSIVISNLRPIDGYVTQTSRYAESKLIFYGGKRILTFSMYVRPKYSTSQIDTYTVVTSNQEFRPDIMSSEFYGTSDYWWRILEANGINDIFEFKAGLNIRLPAVR